MSAAQVSASKAAAANKELLSPCGLYCRFCGIFRAHQSGDEKLKEKLAPIYGCRPEQLVCNGCLSEERFFFCRTCGIRDCAAEKSLEGCHQCDEFPCRLIDEFPIKVGQEIILEAIPKWRSMGTKAWVAAETTRHTCPACGELLIRKARRCQSCKEPVDL
jgi:predicted RNA-binding Zn-ribbon protein involved in translation (DUF1610 family)